MTMQALRGNLGMLARMAARGALAAPRLGLVSSYDPDNYAVKVKLQPPPDEGPELETGWLPLWSPWVGNQWGLYCPPQVDDQVLVLFEEGDVRRGVCLGALYSEEEKPLSVPSKEFWLVHEQGSYLKFTNDGNVQIHSNKDLIATCDGGLQATVSGDANVHVNGTINSTAPTWNHTGDLNVTGKITATTDVVGGGKSLKTHTHPDPQGGSTGAPT